MIHPEDPQSNNVNVNEGDKVFQNEDGKIAFNKIWKDG